MSMAINDARMMRIQLFCQVILHAKSVRAVRDTGSKARVLPTFDP